MRNLVLVVDDDLAVRLLVAEVLRREGYSVQTAQDGRQALEFLTHAERPSVILLDLAMPVMDGWAFRAAQTRDPALARVPVVVFSSERDAAAQAERLGAAAYVSKTVPLDELIGAVRRFALAGLLARRRAPLGR
jgi:CheY-like chemotaxis protein